MEEDITGQRDEAETEEMREEQSVVLMLLKSSKGLTGSKRRNRDLEFYRNEKKLSSGHPRHLLMLAQSLRASHVEKPCTMIVNLISLSLPL